MVIGTVFQGLNSVGAGGSWDPTPLARAPTPYIQAPTSHMLASTPYFQAPTRPSTAPRQMCNFAITRTH